jgi:DNA-binding response OmpR family regulator
MKHRLSPVRVLLIEDDEDDYKLVSELFLELSASKFRLHWVSSYEAALDAVRASDYNVCLLDYRLDGRNGLELFNQMKLLGCTVPVIFLTGQGGYQTDIEAMRAGAADYLTKDLLSAPLLERSIRYAIERKQGQDALQSERNK